MTALLLALLLSQDPPEGLVPPKAECPGPPDYPPSEKATGIGGKVILNLTIDEKGEVTKLEVFQSLAPAFDAAAVESSKKCKFSAAVVNGTPAASIIQLTAEFEPPLKPWTLEGDVVGGLGEPLAGAVVEFGGKRAVTDPGGHFSLIFEELPPGDSWVQVHHEGNADKAFPEVFKPGLTTRVRYQLPKEKAFETRVEGSRLLPPIPEPDRTPQVSKFVVTKADLDRSVGSMEDVTRVAQSAPGVAADPDLLGTLFVRGGGPDETLFYLDGVPLSNPYHLGGFLSIFNPMMLDSAEFYTGGVPARYEPALSGALEVHYATGETKKPHLLVDLSMQSFMIRADLPLGIEGLSAVVSFRRSYFEAYFAILRAAKIVGSNFFAPEITEALARVNLRRGRHHTMATYMFAMDGVNLSISPGEQVLFNFVGDLRLSNQLHLASLMHEIDLGGDSKVSVQGSYTFDSSSTTSTETLPGQDPKMKEIAGRTFSINAKRGDLVLRSDGIWAASRNRVQGGLYFAHRTLHLAGQVPDITASPTWAQYPTVDTHDTFLNITPDIERDLFALYLEDTFRPLESFTVEGGGRVQLESLHRTRPSDLQHELVANVVSGSGRVAAAWTSPISTVVKVSAGVGMQPAQSALLLDPTYGNPRLSAERSWQVVAGVEQPLPIEALLKLELWAKYLDQLVVNPDSRAEVDARRARGEPVFVNQGTGFARGADLLFIGRSRYFLYGLSLGVLASDRTNPLGSGERKTYPTPWDQKFTSALSVTWSPTDKWLVSGRFSFRTGRPYTSVTAFRLKAPECVDKEGASFPCYVPDFSATNGDRYPPFYELSVRVEKRWAAGPVKVALYGEVMNVTNAQNPFVYLYSTGDPLNGIEPVQSSVNHLPIRPFIGVRAEY